ncbi:response regulator transcription factor [Reichenbachiella carrageenanivorans]|uniref:Response regulator transcription factor n=1 Tax=Reichenbachiella carrageenanivorans TaxID=2979869 RepID=A0ABY6CXR9_9BACT|nr:response regulator transcription factor [Reichenbachiella carrageenanivorans]UXX78519.1 response regulator transcription factor [Reichenbachiella carrageenanivorans]
MTTPINILLVDDHKMIREGIKSFLEDHPTYVISAEAQDGKEAIAKYDKRQIDLVITDILMPEMDGIALTTELVRLNPEVKIIALTMLNENHHIKQMLKAGVYGYLLKNCSEEELIHAIGSVVDGNKYYSKEVTDIIMNDLSKDKKPKQRLSVEIPLTPRELEILHLICKEYSNQEISDALFIGMRTVDAHKRNLLEKTGCKNVAGLVVYALERALFDDL